MFSFRLSCELHCRYSSACQVVRSTDRPIATLLVNMGMMSGAYSSTPPCLDTHQSSLAGCRLRADYAPAHAGIYSAVAAAYILSSTGVLQRNT